MSEFVQAINVTIMGMGLVFASLGLLMVIILGLLWALRERPQPALAMAAGPSVAPSSAPFRLDTDPEPPLQAPEVSDEVVAAIAVALAAWKREGSRPPQTTVVTFAPGTPGWRALGRLS